MLKSLKTDDLEVTCDPEWLAHYSQGEHKHSSCVLTITRFSKAVHFVTWLHVQKVALFAGVKHIESQER